MTVVIVGLGSIARKHIKALRQIDPEVEILALRSKEAVEEQGIKNIYSWDEIMSSPDFILIANPTRFHKDSIEQSLRFHVPLFIEKPVLDAPVEGEQLMKQLQSNGLLSYVACNLRFHPALFFLKNYLKENNPRVIEVNVYCGSDLSQWRPGQDYTKSYSAQQELGGGVHLDLIHEIDYCCWMFGFPTKTTSLRRKISHLDINSVDFAAYHLIYSEFTINITLNYYRKQPKRCIEIVTGDHILSADLLKGVVLKDDEELFADPDFKMEETYLKQMNYFVQHARRNASMMNDFGEALEVLKLATA